MDKFASFSNVPFCYRAKHRNKRLSQQVFGKNQLLWDLGMKSEFMPNKSEVMKYIKELDKQFDLVLIAEYFDESLILLDELLCWPYKDLTYLKQNERTPGKLKFCKQTAETQFSVKL